MVDFGVFFVILRMAAEYTFAIASDTVGSIFLVCSALSILLFLLVIVLRIIPPAKNKKFNRPMAKIASVFLVVSLFALLDMTWPWIIDYIDEISWLDEDLLAAIIGIGTCTILAIGFLTASRFFSAKPRNDSLMTMRQTLFVLGVAFVVSTGLMALFHFVFPAFSMLIIVIYVIITLLSFLFWLYDPFIYLLSRLYFKEIQPSTEPTPHKLNRYAVIGCAHNESTVIEQLIKSLYEMTYPRDKYDVFIICDNCTDNTAEIVRTSGATAMERHDSERRGKAFGLEWMFNILDEKRAEGDKYDAYVILDADNLVNESFLTAINDKLNDGHEILQAYLGCKNPVDTWISASYSYAYWVSNSIYQNAHSRVGLSAQMGGTGMVIRPAVLDEIGWQTDSLSEDLVLTSRYVLERNRSCVWVPEAKLYDEKPLKTSPSIRQRTRWMQGHMDALRKYGSKLFVSGIKNLSFKQLDAAFYLARPFLSLMMFIVYFAMIFYNIFISEYSVEMPLLMSPATSYLLLIGLFIVQFFVLFQENHARYIPLFIVQVAFSFTWFPAIFRGLVKRNELYWVSTVHQRNISTKEVEADVLLLEAKERLKDLDNLHVLPLGEILFKATVITKDQLDAALNEQRMDGGDLGDIIVNQGVISQDKLDAYLKIQQLSIEKATREGRSISRLRLGELLVDGKVLKQEQLRAALAYQAQHGGLLGDAAVMTKSISFELMGIIEQLYDILNANHVSSNSAKIFIQACMNDRTESIGTILFEGGLISRQQLALALDIQKQSNDSIGSILLEKGFVSKELLKVVQTIQSIASNDSVKESEEVS